MRRKVKIICAAALVATVHLATSAFTFHVSEAPEWNQFFEEPTVGADVAFSIPLETYKTCWLFGDTFVGQVNDGKRVDCRMIHSSIAIQQFGQKPQFFYPKDGQSHPNR